MAATAAKPTKDTPWYDGRWREKGDRLWAARLRAHQGWWRDERLGLPPGPLSANNNRLVVSMLPLRTHFEHGNMLSPEAVEAVRDRLAGSGGGLIAEDRLRRNLLSSQPLCFNLFGYLRANPDLLLPWVQSFGSTVTAVTRIEIEWAPPKEDHFGGGSAFDAFVEYRLQGGGAGFLGIECKYAEHLPATDVKQVRDPYRTWTSSSGLWIPDAEAALDKAGLRQFWLNTLLVQSLKAKEGYDEGRSIVMSCAEDSRATEATEAVASQLVEKAGLAWVSYEDLLSTVAPRADENWSAKFYDRYLNLALSEVVPG